MKLQRKLYLGGTLLFLGVGTLFFCYVLFVSPHSSIATQGTDGGLWQFIYFSDADFLMGFVGITFLFFIFCSEKIHNWLGLKVIYLTSFVLFLLFYFLPDLISDFAYFHDISFSYFFWEWGLLLSRCGLALAWSLLSFAIVETWGRGIFSFRKASIYVLLLASVYYLCTGLFGIVYLFNLIFSDSRLIDFTSSMLSILDSMKFPDTSLPFINPFLLIYYGLFSLEDLNILPPLIIGIMGWFSIDRKNETLKHPWVWYGIGLYLLLPIFAFRFARSIPAIVILCLMYIAVFILRPTSDKKQVLNSTL